jgi:5'(3')-deoxyribonucleotidase
MEGVQYIILAAFGLVVLFAALHARKKAKKTRFRDWAESEKWRRERKGTRNAPK